MYIQLAFKVMLFLILSSSTAMAVSPTITKNTPTPDTTVVDLTPIPSITGQANNLEDIQRIREIVQQKVKEKLQSISGNGPSKKAFLGKIIQLDATQITVEYRGQTKVATLAADTTFIDTNRNKVKADKIKIGQDALVMCTNNDSVLSAKRVVLVDIKSIETVKTVTLGKIVDISKSSPVFSLIPIKNKNTQYQIKTDKNTVVITKDDKKIAFSDLKSGNKIVAIISPDPKSTKTYIALKIINFDYSEPTPTVKKTQ